MYAPAYAAAKAGGSVLAVTLLHAGTSLWGRLLAPMPSAQPAAAVFTAVNVLLAVALIVSFGGTTLAGSPQALRSLR